jgi:hypothetical protein
MCLANLTNAIRCCALAIIGEPQRVIIVEPLELPVGNPDRAPEPEPTILPEREPVEPEKVPMAP